jgi:hypothetical protein
MSSSIRMRFSIVLAAFVPVLVMVGFGAGVDGPSRLSISGRVSIDGSPFARGTIRFLGMSESGQFTGDVSSIDDGDFAIVSSETLEPGTYLVKINSVGAGGAAAHRVRAGGRLPTAQEWIPSRYNDESVLRVEITRGGYQRFDFDLKL